MDIFPSEEYWRNLGIDPRAALGKRLGPKQIRGLSGWVHADFQIATALTGEIPTLPKRGKGRMLTLFVLQRAPKAGSFLILLKRYCKLVKRTAANGVALENGFAEPLPRYRRVVLLLFQKNPDLLKRVQYRALAIGGSVTYPYVTSEKLDRQKLGSRPFREVLAGALRTALDAEGARRAEVDYVDTKRGDDAVAFSIRYEQKPKRVEQWNEVHYDKLVKRAVLRAVPRFKRLEVICRTARSKDVLVEALSEALWGDPSRFRPESEGGMSTVTEEAGARPTGVVLHEVTIRKLDAENVDLEGSPSITLEAANLEPTLRQLRDMVLDLKGKVVSWSIHVRYTCGDITTGTVVRRTMASNRVQFTPQPPLEVRVEIYRRLRTGLTELALH
jgi:hypothetical protein